MLGLVGFVRFIEEAPATIDSIVFFLEVFVSLSRTLHLCFQLT